MTVGTFYCSADSVMDKYRPTTNFGGATTCEVGFTPAGGKGGPPANWFDSIGNIDVSSLAGAVITAAELHRQIGYVSSGGFAAHVGRCTRPSTWTETGVTWNTYDGVNAWTAPGGDIDGALDFAYTEATVVGNHVITGLKTLVEDALANRSGIVAMILRQDVEPTVVKRIQYNSREGAVNWRLVVDYTVPPPPGRRSRTGGADVLAGSRGVRPRAGVLGVAPRGGVPALGGPLVPEGV